jgi:Na+/H+ antiporter NhaD/arsenite permease-like protein
MLATGVVSLPQAVEVLTDSTNVLPNIAIFGSLSSMLWLFLLRRRGLDIHPLQYLKLGLMITPLMLIVGALSLYACGLFWG